MKQKGSRREVLKSAAIGVLLVSAALLTLRLWLVSLSADTSGRAGFDTFDWLPELPGSQLAAEAVPTLSAAVVTPAFALLRAGGESKAACLDTAASAACWQALAPYLYASLADGAHRTVDAAAWSETLLRDGAFFDLGRYLPFPALTLLGGRTADSALEGLYVRYICLTDGPGTVRLLLRDEAAGDFYEFSLADELQRTEMAGVINTLWSGESLRAARLLCEVTPREAGFDTTRAPGETLVPADVSGLSILREKNPVDGGADDYVQRVSGVLAALRFNSSNTRHYTESDGSIVYVENAGRVRLTAGGVLEYGAFADSPGIALGEYLDKGSTNGSVYDMLAAGCTLLQRLDEEVTGGDAATLQLTGVSYDADSGHHTLCFDYQTDDGLWVGEEGVHAAELEMDGTSILAATVRFRAFYRTDETAETMPCLLALRMALAAQTSAPDDFRLSRRAEEGGLLLPEWVTASRRREKGEGQ